MNIVKILLKSFVNFFLFCFYCLIGIFLENFIFWFILNNLLNKNVPGKEDPIHLHLAIFTIILIFIITLFLRKYLYLSLTKEENLEINTQEIKNNNNSEEQKMEIFIDKEIK